MKVQFEFTAADMAEVASRAADRSPLVRKWRTHTRAAWSILVGLVAFFVMPGDPKIRAATALASALILFFAITRRKAGGNPRMLEFYRERLGGDGPFPCEVEITEAGVVSRQLGTESRHE